VVQHLANALGRQADRKGAVLKTVVVEDVAEARGDEGAKALSTSTVTACSRLEPQPKLRSAIRICAPFAVAALSGKPSRGVPSSR
jgi:hypothetical protein